MTDEQVALHNTIQVLKMTADENRDNMLLDFLKQLLKESFQ
jgi:hypothetical protein